MSAFVEVTDNSISKEDLITMEGKIINLLEFQFGATTSYTFL